MAGSKIASFAMLPALTRLHRAPNHTCNIARTTRRASTLLSSRIPTKKPAKSPRPAATRPPPPPKMATDDLIRNVTAYVRAYMANYDPSHDYDHIRRVVHLAQQLHAAEPPPSVGKSVV